MDDTDLLMWLLEKRSIPENQPNPGMHPLTLPQSFGNFKYGTR